MAKLFLTIVPNSYKLGRVVSLLDRDYLRECHDHLDWTVEERSRALCFDDERSADTRDRCKSTFSEFSGMNKILLSWTGTEYLYHFLIHNQADLPDEAFAMLRYVAIVDWSTFKCTHIESALVPFVEEFRCFVDIAQNQCFGSKEMTTDECHRCWSSTFEAIAHKYNLGESLRW
jgi:hypothetical protein